MGGFRRENGQVGVVVGQGAVEGGRWAWESRLPLVQICGHVSWC